VSDNSNIEPNDRTLAFIPKRNFVGIGCKRGVSGQQIIEAINISLKKCDLSLSSVAGIATIDLKKNEQGLIEVARLLSLDVRFFSAEELSLVNAKSTSSFVKSKVGVGAVSEPAAMLVAGEDSKIIMSKNIVGGVTISIARANWPLSE
jgi:cobalamin biosynthesis protein CbiG